MARSLTAERIAQGLCPRCGTEAAPYRLCSKHRAEGMIGRICERASRAGGFKKEKRGNRIYWSLGNRAALDSIKWSPDVGLDDKRRRPRLGGIPVDVEKQLVAILTEAGRPLGIEEIISAWGKLRERRTGSIASNLAAIITAQQRRASSNAKRAAQHRGAEP